MTLPFAVREMMSPGRGLRAGDCGTVGNDAEVRHAKIRGDWSRALSALGWIVFGGGAAQIVWVGTELMSSWRGPLNSERPEMDGARSRKYRLSSGEGGRRASDFSVQSWRIISTYRQGDGCRVRLIFTPPE